MVGVNKHWCCRYIESIYQHPLLDMFSKILIYINYSITSEDMCQPRQRINMYCPRLPPSKSHLWVHTFNTKMFLGFFGFFVKFEVFSN